MSGSKLSEDSSVRGTPEAGTPGAAPFWEQPLGLTVHSMPAADQALAQRRRGGRWKMIAVLLICAAPVVASYFTYYVVRPEGRRNFGDLIDPQRPLPEQRALPVTGRMDNLRSLRGQWLLLSVSGGGCDPGCQNHLYLQRQLRESLGKDKDRVDWVWLVSDDAPLDERLLPALKDATVLRVAGSALSAWLQPAPGHQLSEHLYVVDPMGNWMMRFPAGLDKATSARARRDLERLLRASESWDSAGR